MCELQSNTTFICVCLKVVDSLQQTGGKNWTLEKLKDDRRVINDIDDALQESIANQETTVKKNVRWFCSFVEKMKLLAARCFEIDAFLTINDNYFLKYSAFEANDIQIAIVSWWFYKNMHKLKKKMMDEMMKIYLNRFYISSLLELQIKYSAVNPFKSFNSIQHFKQLSSWFKRVQSYCLRRRLFIRFNVQDALNLEKQDYAPSLLLTEDEEMMTKYFFPVINKDGPYQMSKGCQLLWYDDCREESMNSQALQVKYTVKRIYNVTINILHQTENFINFPLPAKTSLKKLPFSTTCTQTNQTEDVALFL